MQLVYSSDLHGAIDLYQQLLDLAVAEQATAAIVGGDLLPHAQRLASALDMQRGFIHDQLAPLLRRYQARHPELMLYVIPGNDDWAAAIQELHTLEQDGLLRTIHHRAVELQTGLWLNGSGLIGLTPFGIKDYERRDTADAPPVRFGQSYRSEGDTIQPYPAEELLALPTLAEELATLAQASDPRRTIYVLHCPPWQTLLDRRHGGAATGSRAVRDFIQQHQPPLTLHGHIHEGPTVSGAWLEQLGDTVAINPGQAQRGFHAVTLDTDSPLATARHTVYGDWSSA